MFHLKIPSFWCFNCGGFPCILVCGCPTRTTLAKPPKVTVESPDGSKNKTRLPAPQVFCSYCHREYTAQYYLTRTWFTFFFLPLFPVAKTVKWPGCPVCRHYAEPIREGRIYTCPTCSIDISTMYPTPSFCPHCGNQIRH